MDLIRKSVWKSLLDKDEKSLVYLLKIELDNLGYDKFFDNVGIFTSYLNSEYPELESKFSKILMEV